MSALGEGILAGFQGAIGAADDYIREERDYNRKLSLADLQHERQLELQRLREEFAVKRDATNFARDIAKQDRGILLQQQEAERQRELATIDRDEEREYKEEQDAETRRLKQLDDALAHKRALELQGLKGTGSGNQNASKVADGYVDKLDKVLGPELFSVFTDEAGPLGMNNPGTEATGETWLSNAVSQAKNMNNPALHRGLNKILTDYRQFMIDIKNAADRGGKSMDPALIDQQFEEYMERLKQQLQPFMVAPRSQGSEDPDRDALRSKYFN